MKNKNQIIDERKANHNRIDSINDMDTLKAECKLWYDMYLSTLNEKKEWEKSASEKYVMLQQCRQAFVYINEFAKKIKDSTPKGVR